MSTGHLRSRSDSMLRWLLTSGAGAGACLGVAMSSAAAAQGGFPPGPSPVLLGDTIVLDGDRSYRIDSLVVERDTTILIGEHDLSIEIAREFEAKGTLLIRAYPADMEPNSPPPLAGTGTSGVTYNPGPGTNGNGADNGRNGGSGTTGPKGATGTPGEQAGSLLFRLGANATARGRLVIDLRGGPGGHGGRGGQGGNGGDGEQGQPGRRDKFGFCSGGGGFGGSGGNGGLGGPGGKGGNGGPGGVVVLEAEAPALLEWLRSIEVYVSGGRGGPTGEGGAGGDPGAAGWGGAANGDPPLGCTSQEVARRGTPGEPGLPGSGIDEGDPGKDGTLLVLE